MMRPPRASVRSSRRHSCSHSVRGSPSANIRKPDSRSPECGSGGCVTAWCQDGHRSAAPTAGRGRDLQARRGIRTTHRYLVYLRILDRGDSALPDIEVRKVIPPNRWGPPRRTQIPQPPVERRSSSGSHCGCHPRNTSPPEPRHARAPNVGLRPRAARSGIDPPCPCADRGGLERLIGRLHRDCLLVPVRVEHRPSLLYKDRGKMLVGSEGQPAEVAPHDSGLPVLRDLSLPSPHAWSYVNCLPFPRSTV